MSFKTSVVLLLTVAVFACFGFGYPDRETAMNPPAGKPLDILPDNAEEIAQSFAEEHFPALAVGESIRLLAPDLQARVIGFLTHENDQGTASIECYLDCLHQYRSIRHDTHYYVEEQEGLGVSLDNIFKSGVYAEYHELSSKSQRELDMFGLILVSFISDTPVLLYEEPTIPYCLKSSVSGSHLLPEDKDFYAYGIVSMGFGSYYSMGVFSTDNGTLFAITLDGKLKEFDMASFGNLLYYPIDDCKGSSGDDDVLLDGVLEINQNDNSGDCTLASLAMSLYYLISELGFTSNFSLNDLSNDRDIYNDQYLKLLHGYYEADDYWNSKIEEFYWREEEDDYYFSGIPVSERNQFNSDFLGSTWVNLCEPSDYEIEYTLTWYAHPHQDTALVDFKECINNVRKRIPSFQSIKYDPTREGMHRIFCYGYDSSDMFAFYNPWSNEEGTRWAFWEDYWKDDIIYGRAYIPINYLGPGGTGDDRLVISESSEDAQFLRWSPYLNFDVKGYTVLSRDDDGQITQLSGVIRNDGSGGWQHFETEAEGELGVRYYPVGDGEPVDVFDGEEADFE